MPRRGDTTARPEAPSGWKLKFASKDAADGWEDLARQLTNATNTAYDHISEEPRSRKRPDRQHQLKGELATRDVSGKTLEQWQYEVSGAARVWYAIDDPSKTIWIVAASTRHPKQTE